MRRFRTSFALLLASAAFGQDVQSMAQRAVELQQSGDFSSAAAAYSELLKVAPSDVATHVNYGVVLVNLRRYDEAIAQYEAAEKLLPGDPRIELNLGLAYAKSGRTKQALAVFERVHAADPQNSQVTLLLADSCLQMQQYQRVVDLLQPVKDSDDLGVAYMLGMALLRTQHPSEAQTYLDRILRNGDTAEARYLQGIQAYESANYPDAVKYLSGAAELNAALPHVHSMLGNALLYTGDPDAALKDFDLTLKLEPEDPASLLGKAQILTARKQFEAALPLARQAVKLDPHSVDAKLTLAEDLIANKSFKEAQSLVEQATAAEPQSEHAHRILATAYRVQRMTGRAAAETKIADDLAAKEDPGPQVNQPAPEFTLADAATGETVRLSDFRAKSPVTLVFGSYTCPNFRASADALKRMQQRYGNRVPFLLVYIREAHAAGQWQTGRNTADDSTIEPAASMSDKTNHAAMCSRKLHLPFPALVDGMDGAVEAAYNAWPSRAYIIGRDGRIAYSTRLTELDFDPERMESVLRKLATP